MPIVPPNRCQLTMLNSMGGRDFAQALDRHVEWGIRILDLKDSIFGKGVIDLTDEELPRAKLLIDQRGLRTYCLSTALFHGEVEQGNEAFVRESIAKVDRAIEIARVLRPRFIRLLAAQTRSRRQITHTTQYLRANCPWVIPAYRAAVERIHAAGFEATIENEVGGCIWSRPQEVLSFFDELGLSEAVSFTWDIQNLWQMGTPPSLEVYEALKPMIGFVHVKGGQSQTPLGPLKWSSALADASWPVVEILRKVVADGVTDAICVNPSHGAAKPGYDYSNVHKRDIDFLRREIPEIE